MTQERIMFSNPTLSEPRLSPAATMSDATPSALTPPLHCTSILLLTTPPQVVAFESETISAPIFLNCFTSFPLPCALAFPPPSHRDATTPSPCWAPHFMTQERIMFSNPTLSEPRLSPVSTISDDTPSALTPLLHCTSILQPAAPPQVVAFES